jgi:hypothetical protein
VAVITLTRTVAPGDGAAAVTVARTALTSTTDSYRFANDGSTVLLFEKTGVADCTVTVVTPAQLAGIGVADPSFTVPASTGDVIIGPFMPSVFNDAGGYASFTITNSAGLSVGVASLGA